MGARELINALREKPCTKKELVGVLRTHFSNKLPEALRKECERSVKKLKAWGLVEDCDGHYRWYRYDSDFSGHEDLGAKLLHSHRLVPALRRLAGIYVGHYQVGQPAEFESQEDALIRDASAENHIIACLDVWPLYDAFRKLEEKSENEKKAFNTRLMQKLYAKFKQKLIKSGGTVRPKSYVKDNVPSLIFTQIVRNCKSVSFETKKDGEVWLDGILIAKGKRLSSQVKAFVKEEINNQDNVVTVNVNLRTENEAAEAQLKFQQVIRKLIMRVESGEPLLGGCDTCPKVFIGLEGRHSGVD